ncbi:MAG: HTH domain-containing protein, partial [Prevotella sp.]
NHILSERQTLIKSLININPNVSAKQMSEVLSVSARTIERELSIMQKAGIIRREGNVKTGVWIILTDKKI